MSGLRPNCDSFAPWGYNSSLQPLGRKVEVPVVPPSDNNKHAIPPPPWARLHVPVPVTGPMKVPLHTQDRYGNMNANPSPFPVSNPRDFNKNEISTNYNHHMPPAQKMPLKHKWLNLLLLVTLNYRIKI